LKTGCWLGVTAPGRRIWISSFTTSPPAPGLRRAGQIPPRPQPGGGRRMNPSFPRAKGPLPSQPRATPWVRHPQAGTSPEPEFRSRPVAAGIPACRRAGLPSPAEGTARTAGAHRTIPPVFARLAFVPGGKAAARYVRQRCLTPRCFGIQAESTPTFRAAIGHAILGPPLWGWGFIHTSPQGDALGWYLSPRRGYGQRPGADGFPRVPGGGEPRAPGLGRDGRGRGESGRHGGIEPGR